MQGPNIPMIVINGRAMNGYVKQKNCVNVSLAYDNEEKNGPVSMAITYHKDQIENEQAMPMLYQEKTEHEPEELSADDKLFAPTLDAIADLPNDSLLTLVTIIAEDDDVETIPITYNNKENEIPEIPEEGENITYVDKNSENTIIDEDAYGEKIVLRLV